MASAATPKSVTTVCTTYDAIGDTACGLYDESGSNGGASSLAPYVPPISATYCLSSAMTAAGVLLNSNPVARVPRVLRDQHTSAGISRMRPEMGSANLKRKMAPGVHC
jgi:hypothetical protein